MEHQKQTFDELYALVMDQIQMQMRFLRREKWKTIRDTSLMGILLSSFLGIMGGDFIVAIGFIGPIFLFLILMIFIGFDSDKTDYSKGIHELYLLTKGTNKKIEDYKEIITILKHLKKMLHKKYKFLGMGAIEIDIRYNQQAYFDMIQKNLYFDLMYRIHETKIELQSAKYAVETSIRGTSDLNHVAELQKTRLNHQIKEFEKLQKILVKQ